MVTITSLPRVAPADSIWTHIINDAPSITVAMVVSVKEAAEDGKNFCNIREDYKNIPSLSVSVTTVELFPKLMLAP